MRRTVTTTLILLVAGCASSTPSAQQEALKRGGAHSSLSIRSGGAIAPDLGATRKVPQLVTLLDVYELTVPVGAISGNDEFWKRVDALGERPYYPPADLDGPSNPGKG